MVESVINCDVTARLSYDDGELCLTVEFLGEYWVMNYLVMRSNDAVACLNKKLRLFAAGWRALLFGVVRPVVASRA